jgi:hypothetical protein
LNTITIDTHGNERLQEEANELGLKTHPIECTEGAAGEGVWRLSPESPGVQISYDPALFTASLAEGKVIIARRL